MELFSFLDYLVYVNTNKPFDLGLGNGFLNIETQIFYIDLINTNSLCVWSFQDFLYIRSYPLWAGIFHFSLFRLDAFSFLTIALFGTLSVMLKQSGMSVNSHLSWS